MTDEEKKAIKELRDSYELHQCEWAKRCLDAIQESFEKKDKIIDGMARSIVNYDSQLVINHFKDKEHVKEFYKEYFEKKEG